MPDFDEFKPDNSGGKADGTPDVPPSDDASSQQEDDSPDFLMPETDSEDGTSESDDIEASPPAMPIISTIEGSAEEMSDTNDEDEEFLEEDSEDFVNLFDEQDDPADLFEAPESLDTGFIDEPVQSDSIAVESEAEVDISEIEIISVEDEVIGDDRSSETIVAEESSDEVAIVDETITDEAPVVEASTDTEASDDAVSSTTVTSPETTPQATTADTKTGTTPASTTQAKSDTKSGTTPASTTQAKPGTKASTTPASTTQAKSDTKTGTTPAKSDTKTGTSPAKSDTKAGTSPAKSDTKAGTSPAKSDTKASTTPASTTQAKSDTKASTAPAKSDTKTGTSPAKSDTKAGTSPAKSDTKAGTTTAKSDAKTSTTQAKSDTKARTTQAKNDTKAGTTPASTTQAKSDTKAGTTPAKSDTKKSAAKTSTTQAKSDTKAGTTPAKSDTKAGTTPAKSDTQAGTTPAKSDTQAGTSPAKSDTQAGTTTAKSDTKAGTTPAKSDTKASTTPSSSSQPKSDTTTGSTQSQDTRTDTTAPETEIKPPPPPPDAPQSAGESIPESAGATPLAAPAQPASINPQRRQRANAVTGTRPNIVAQNDLSSGLAVVGTATQIVQSIIPTSSGLTPEEIVRTPIFWRWGDMFWVISAYVSVVLLQARGFQAPDTTRFIVSLVVSSLLILMALGFLVWAINTYLTRRARGRTQGLALRIFFIVQNSVWLLTLILTIIGLTVESQVPAQVMIYLISVIALLWWGVKLFLRIDNRHLMRSYDYVTNTTVLATMFMTFVFIIIGTGLMNGNGSTRLSIIDPETAYGTLNIVAMTIAIISSLVFLVVVVPEQMRYTDTQNRLRRIIEFMGTVAAGNALSVAGLSIGIAVAAVSPNNAIGLTLAANIITIAALTLVPYDTLAKIRDARQSSGYKEVYLVVMILLLLVITLISMLNFAFALAKDDNTNAVTALVAAGLGIVSIVMEIIQLAIVGDGKERKRDWGKIIGNIFLLVATTMAITGAAGTFNTALDGSKLAFAIVGLVFFILALVLKVLAELDLLGVIWRGLGSLWQSIMSRRAIPGADMLPDVTPIDVVTPES